MIRTLTTAALAAAILLPGALGAEEGKEKKPKGHGDYAAVLALHDGDKDGALSADEIKAIPEEKLKEKVLAFDADKDGAVSAAEGEAAKADWKKAGKKDKGEKKKEGEQ